MATTVSTASPAARWPVSGQAPVWDRRGDALPRVGAQVIHDRDDERVPLTSAEALTRYLPRAEMVTTAGLGHTAILTDPGVLARIGEFFPPAGSAS